MLPQAVHKKFSLLTTYGHQAVRFDLARPYGCIVDAGVGDAEVIGDGEGIG
ncbi:MAG: hypothetical protein WBW87_11080 [Candidatus Cybelea sp.]